MKKRERKSAPRGSRDVLLRGVHGVEKQEEGIRRVSVVEARINSDSFLNDGRRLTPIARFGQITKAWPGLSHS